ncbi:MAG: bifunctional methylenetetrahydrofolate dehydrogenase/methenyltetrahydrofolate cyclohydrolase FolD [Ruminococcaceae bacterium]|nr:bifunctional methylenetetrahydrofolate dehydrogenase/methenyltetrahydrofolate cyclohydrolase FolD [Oscillospiraceae bacterium]
MSAQLISGKILAAQMKESVAKDVAALKEKSVHARLAVIIVGDNPASKVYVAGKAKDCEECGILSDVIRMPEDTTEEQLLAKVHECNENDEIHGLLVQLPLPKHIREKNIIDAISPAKDVDGFTPVNVGKLVIGEDCFMPCTPAGCIEMLKSTGMEISGKNAVVIGRSNIVGKPAALMLLANNATVTICHSKTQNLKQLCAQADILVAAIGKAGFVTGDMVKEGAAVIDVGINRGDDGKLHGDVDFEAASEKAAFITPVPGGVGLMTRAMLMKNTLKAAQTYSGDS